jgi:hypothetical protein
MNCYQVEEEALELKAKSLAFLGKFRMSIDLFKSIGHDIEWVEDL